MLLCSSNKHLNFKPKSSVCTNFAMRFAKNISSRKLDQKLIHSHFYPTHTFSSPNVEFFEVNKHFTCCTFLVS